jgi:hypothetical protein
MNTVPAAAHKTSGTTEETVQVARLKADHRPLIAVLVAVGLAGAGILGYMLGR